MDTTLANNDLMLINRMAYKSNIPHYKDIVAFNTNINNGEIFIKRVIGVPGDILKINDKMLDEKYIKESMKNNGDMEMIIPEGKIFVMGDNRNNSLDSRSSMLGLVDYKKAVIGKVMFRIYPFKQTSKY